jgi:hypothetical protein
MKNTMIKGSIAILIAVLQFTGCKKEAGSRFTSINSFYEQSKPASQSFTVNGSTGGTITGTKGTRITFPANAFVNANGTIVTGPVTVELREILTKADMIYSKVFPIAYGWEPLNSGGEFFVGATANGNKVNLRKGKFMDVTLPAQATDPNMKLFLGQDTAGMVWWNEPVNDTVAVDSQWVPSPVGGFAFTSIPSDAYVIQVDTMGYCNADAYMTNLNQYADCNFTFNESFTVDASNTTAYALFDGKQSMWPLGMTGTIANNVINDYHLADIPTHILVITVNNGQLYSGSLAVTPANGGNYPIDLSATTKADLDALILSFH